MPDLFDTLPSHEQAARAAAQGVALLLSEPGPLKRATLNDCMAQAFGADHSGWRWTQRDSFEVLEQGVVAHLLATKAKCESLNDVRSMIDFARRLPTQTVRSEQQIDLQQFSTPADLAAYARLLAAPQGTDIVLEPSAGNGLLVATLPPVARLLLNEIDARRRDGLAASFPHATITTHDGAALHALIGQGARPTLILMNPPFSRSLGRGKDDLAAARHLEAALRLLQPAGRCVAIMPDWFAPSARMRQTYEAILAGCSVTFSARLDNAFAKHGTGIAVRIYVIDKKPGLASPALIERRTLGELLEATTIPARTAGAPTDKPARPRSPSVSLFRAVKSKPASSPARIFRAPKSNDVLPVGYKPLGEPAPLLEQSGVYLPYRPSRISFDAAGEHPTPLVESVAMGAVPNPMPRHVPVLPERTVSERQLSASQLETVIYAGDAWSQDLAGKLMPAKTGLGLVPNDEGFSYRKGYFLGDGTGAGKGRQIAACILDNWLQGRRRAIWISKNAALVDDARRDWASLGGLPADIRPLSDWKIDEPIRMAEGILFATYPTLASGRGENTRLQQIFAWAGADYDGVIAFDEAHEMGGVAGGQGMFGTLEGSRQGICGVELQNRLPRARILYASATGASDVNNLAYAVRLGLWGPGTAFPDRETFTSEIRQGGLAAMELVARDLKAMGLYAARALSFAGVEYDILRHALTPDQIADYDAYAGAWSVIHRNLQAALETTGIVDAHEGTTLNSGAKAAAHSRFESCKQRFFGQLLLSMKLPTVIAAIEDHLADDKSVVLQLVTTAEAILDRRLAGLSAEERAEPDIDLSPREYVIDYLERAFPTRQMQARIDDTGTPYSVPMSDEHGHPVHNPDAVAMRETLIEQLCALPPIKSVLDALLERFGTNRVAEVTGRTKRLVTGPDGRQKIESRSPRAGQADASAFMAGQKRILVFSYAGGTGRSYHASLDAHNQQQRVHLLLEPGWRADRAIQGLGRTHRTHQASTPLFRPVTTDCKGELRFTSTIARRLDTLGALTRGQRQTGGQNLFDPADNLESDYAKAALVTWFHLLNAGKLRSTNMADFQARSGLMLLDKDGVLKDDLPPIQRWLNRILALPIALQNEIFDEFLALVTTRVEAAREAGTLDIGVETIMAEQIRILDDKLLRTDPVCGATTHLLTLEITRQRKAMSLRRAHQLAAQDPGARLMINAKSSKCAIAFAAPFGMDDEGNLIGRTELRRPGRSDFIRTDRLGETAWEEVSPDDFDAAWTAELAHIAAHPEVDIVQLATGLLLPIWGALPADHLTVNRVVDAQGNSWLGRILHEGEVARLLRHLGLDADTALSPGAILKSVMAGQSVELAGPIATTVKRSLVDGHQRIELVGVPPAHLPMLKTLGCFTEIIAYRTRVFVPIERAEAIFAALQPSLA